MPASKTIYLTVRVDIFNPNVEEISDDEALDRGAWRATIHGVTRVGQDLVTKPTPHVYKNTFWDFDRPCIKSVDEFRKIRHL